jgi:Arm DNA-binding domain
MEASDSGFPAGVTTNYLRLTDAAIRAATLPSGKSQHYLHDTEQPGLAIRMRATGGRTWVYLFTKPGARGTQRKTLGAWPRFNEKAARQAATIAAGEVAKGGDPNDAKRVAAPLDNVMPIATVLHQALPREFAVEDEQQFTVPSAGLGGCCCRCR